MPKGDELQDLSFNPPSGEQDPLVLMLTRIVSFEGIPGCEHRIMDSYPIQPMEDDLHSVIGQRQCSLTWRHLRCLRFLGSTGAYLGRDPDRSRGHSAVEQ